MCGIIAPVRIKNLLAVFLHCTVFRSPVAIAGNRLDVGRVSSAKSGTIAMRAVGVMQPWNGSSLVQGDTGRRWAAACRADVA